MSTEISDVSQTVIKVLFFAKAKDIVGNKEQSLTISKINTYNQLLETIVSHFNLRLIQNSIVLAKNGVLLNAADKNLIQLDQSDEIAIIPPLSGG